MQPTGVSKDSAVWFVDLNGQLKGPFTLEQISDAFHSGQLQARQKVSSEELHGKFMTVEEAAELFQRRTGTGTIHLPPRPSELVQGGAGGPAIPPPAPPVENDPAHSLFEVLQTVKDRKPTQGPRAQVVSDPSVSRVSSGRIPGQVWLILSITLVLGVSGWVLAVLMKRTGEIAKSPQTETVRAVSPAPPPAPAAASPPIHPPPTPPAPKYTVKPFVAPVRPAVVPKFTPVIRDDRDRERDRDRDRDERDRDDRDRDRDDRDRDQDRNRDLRDPRDDDPRDWRMKDGVGDATHTDNFGGVPGTEPGAPPLRPAPAPAAPPPRPDDPDHPSSGGR